MAKRGRKRQANVDEWEGGNDEVIFSGPFSAEIIVCIARYLTAREVVIWASCSKNMASLLLREESLWRGFIKFDWSPVTLPARLRNLMDDAKGSSRKVYERLCRSRQNWRNCCESLNKPYKSMVQSWTNWSTRGYPYGPYLARLTDLKTDGLSTSRHPKFIIEAIDFISGSRIFSWDCTAKLESSPLIFDYAFKSNDRFIVVKMAPDEMWDDVLDDFVDDPAELWIFDLERKSDPVIVTLYGDMRDQTLALRSSQVWTINYLASDPALPDEWYTEIIAFSATTGEIEYSYRIIIDNHISVIFEPESCLDDTHFIYFTRQSVGYVDIQSKTVLAQLVGYDFALHYFQQMILTPTMIVTVFPTCIFVWRRPTEEQHTPVQPTYVYNSSFGTKIHKVTLSGPDSLVVTTSAPLAFSNIVLLSNLLSPLYTIEPLEKHASLHPFYFMGCSDPTICLGFTWNRVVGWDLRTKKKTMEWDLNNFRVSKYLASKLNMETDLRAFVDGPYLVIVVPWELHLFDLSCENTPRNLRPRGRRPPEKRYKSAISC